MPIAPSIRKIRQVVDPATLVDTSAQTNTNVANITANDQTATQDAIQRRIDQQAAQQAAAAKAQQAKIASTSATAQSRIQAQLNSPRAKSDAKYKAYLDDQAAKLGISSGGPTYDAANMAPNHSAAYQKDLNWANKQVAHPSQDWNFLCQSFARQATGASAWAPSARLAWNSTPAQHKHNTYPPPAGSIAYYGNKSGTGSGHAVFVADNGMVYSTDIKRKGKVDIVKWDVFKTKWNMVYLGWIDATPSGKLPVQAVGGAASKGKPAPPKKSQGGGHYGK